ncbi:hypothetical protein [Sulfurimonas hydrogeniphila]|uniref:hypothetical protein n=1 Tax=Sulfurimonas hydrogeniphila TaxID=2509341 RepID=UPI00125EB1A6|nr:hypothetical protein [Sulfurimonas hydrogeniphila]
MFQGLSLEQAPPYAIPIKFYLSGAFYLILLSVAIAIYGFSIGSRFDYEVIALTHLLTLGFITHVMFGSLFQMLPVMLATPYTNVIKNATIIHIALNAGILSFVVGFLTNTPLLLYLAGAVLSGTFFYFAILSFKTVLLSQEKNTLVQNFAASFIALFAAALFGALALLGHFGFVDTLRYGNTHIAFMLFGWVFLLIVSVSYKIIPMFFVAKEFPIFLQKRLYPAQLVFLLLFAYAQLQEKMLLLTLTQILLCVPVIIFALLSIQILRKRKRARKDASIQLWYFAMGNAVLASLLFTGANILHVNLSFAIGFFTLFGAVYALINAMLYKIIPFLTWFHLSSNMVFDAEMGDVIPKKKMNIQINLYYLTYFFFLCTVLSPAFIIPSATLFLFSSLLLLLNILKAQKYYNEYMKKKVVFE